MRSINSEALPDGSAGPTESAQNIVRQIEAFGGAAMVCGADTEFRRKRACYASTSSTRAAVLLKAGVFEALSKVLAVSLLAGASAKWNG